MADIVEKTNIKSSTLSTEFMLDIRSRLRSISFIGAVTVMLLLAFGLRSYALEADAPHYLSISQGLTTDGANTVFAGRNKALFGQWSPELKGYPGVDQSTLAMDWASFITFKLLGVGYWQGGYLAVLISLLMIAVVVAFAKQQFGNRAALLAALFLTTNYPFLIYNRIPVAYTMVGLVMALTLYCLGRSPGNALFLVASIALTVFGIVSVKIAAIASLPMVIVGSSILIFRRYLPRQKKKTRLFLLIGLLTLAIIALVAISPGGISVLNRVQVRTLNFEYGLVENIRFLVTSTLEFGIYSAFFVRMLPLFGLSFGYVFFRVAQYVSGNSPILSFGEIMGLMYLIGVAGMLLLSIQQPTRHLILLVPPMSLISALAIEKMLQTRKLKTSSNLGYFFPIIVFLGLTYLYYQLLAAVYRVVVAFGMGTSLGDYDTITPLPTLHIILVVALVIAFLTTIPMIAVVSGSGKRLNALLAPGRLRFVVVILIAILFLGDLYQYTAWARSPEYSIVVASRQIKEDLGSDIVLGGAYAAVLGMENDIPGILFFEKPLRNPEYQQRVLDSDLTHIAMEAESIFGEIPINDQVMREHAPEFVDHLQLLKTYFVRGYYVRVYEIGKQ